jgi:hypothetical protein
MFPSRWRITGALIVLIHRDIRGKIAEKHEIFEA